MNSDDYWMRAGGRSGLLFRDQDIGTNGMCGRLVRSSVDLECVKLVPGGAGMVRVDIFSPSIALFWSCVFHLGQGCGSEGSDEGSSEEGFGFAW